MQTGVSSTSNNMEIIIIVPVVRSCRDSETSTAILAMLVAYYKCNVVERRGHWNWQVLVVLRSLYYQIHLEKRVDNGFKKEA
jgi:hypothetical protein